MWSCSSISASLSSPSILSTNLLYRWEDFICSSVSFELLFFASKSMGGWVMLRKMLSLDRIFLLTFSTTGLIFLPSLWGSASLSPMLISCTMEE